MRFVMGVDLGQAHDHAGVCILETQVGEPTRHHIRFLERFALGTPYPAVVDRICELACHPEVPRCRVTVDSTGVGRPVVDLLEKRSLRPIAITLTGGSTVSREGRHFRVPKRDIVSNLVVLFQTERLKIARSLRDTDMLVRELLGFQMKISPSGHDTYEAKHESIHDDLVVAVALAAWYAEREGGHLAALRQLATW